MALQRGQIFSEPLRRVPFAERTPPAVGLTSMVLSDDGARAVAAPAANLASMGLSGGGAHMGPPSTATVMRIRRRPMDPVSGVSDGSAGLVDGLCRPIDGLAFFTVLIYQQSLSK